ncbi:hypothetical protein P153DRAFT_55878 [Dothidotthia symphoricarpi CBS 119687]|uniref:Uncharacterized protein n=1 Tax=Dothidotthia symphoricarpi CBS 119687 TaxID=1392245 RepID=A0A6A6AAS4_9PLEO|nr:uncharacterized protein P153DRAFT_55878 [Dothidotthia symphoricarpi CBS 119687]KAF2127801.1 hypothetical protein P153DRAFT_55878 [Dothidotthia symphoricarpi CBS 119687]
MHDQIRESSPPSDGDMDYELYAMPNANLIVTEDEIDPQEDLSSAFHEQLSTSDPTANNKNGHEGTSPHYPQHSQRKNRFDQAVYTETLEIDPLVHSDQAIRNECALSPSFSPPEEWQAIDRASIKRIDEEGQAFVSRLGDREREIDAMNASICSDQWPYTMPESWNKLDLFKLAKHPQLHAFYAQQDLIIRQLIETRIEFIKGACYTEREGGLDAEHQYLNKQLFCHYGDREDDKALGENLLNREMQQMKIQEDVLHALPAAAAKPDLRESMLDYPNLDGQLDQLGSTDVHAFPLILHESDDKQQDPHTVAEPPESSTTAQTSAAAEASTSSPPPPNEQPAADTPAPQDSNSPNTVIPDNGQPTSQIYLMVPITLPPHMRSVGVPGTPMNSPSPALSNDVVDQGPIPVRLVSRLERIENERRQSAGEDATHGSGNNTRLPSEEGEGIGRIGPVNSVAEWQAGVARSGGAAEQSTDQPSKQTDEDEDERMSKCARLEVGF